MKKINYKGYIVSQADNNHVMITKNDKVVFHASCTKKMSEEQLKKQVDDFIELLNIMNKGVDE